MSTAKGPPGGPPGQRGRRRRAPTIDLKATEIASEAASPPDPVAAASEPAAVPSAPSPEPVSTAPSEPPPRNEEPAIQASGAGEPPPPPPTSPPWVAWLPPDFPWPLVGAGAAGAVLALLIVFVVSLFTGREPPAAPADTRLDARLGRLEQQLRELVARPASTDTKAIDDLTTRMARIESAMANPKPPPTDLAVSNRLATVEGELRSLAERDGVLLRRNDEIAVIAGEARKLAEQTLAAVADLKKTASSSKPAIERGEFEALATRIAGLEKTLKSIEARLAQDTGAATADRIARQLAAVMALDAAVTSGRPFVTELEAARAVLDAKALAPLAAFAKTGLPTHEALARELVQLLPAVAKAIGASGKSDGGFLDRLAANAGRIIRVRPIDDVSGDDPAAVLARIEARAAHADTDGALQELAKLPDAARAPAQSWIDRAKARNAAVQGLRRAMISIASGTPAR